MTTTHYTHLQPEERQTIASLLQQGKGHRFIAQALGRSRRTIDREILRNGNGEEAVAVAVADPPTMPGYGSVTATVRSQARRQAAWPLAKLHPEGLLWLLVSAGLAWRWSPQQIAGALQRVYPDNAAMQVSHETIYTTIYAHAAGELRKQLIACLRQGHRQRLPRRRGQDRRGGIPAMVSLHLRPPAIEDRVLPGHWEGDLIKGANNRSSVGVLVERSSRLVLLAKMEDATAAAALQAFSAKLRSIAAPMRKTLTYDQGREMAQHAELTRQTQVAVYFCDPHSPWQRGTCENTNGLLRQYLPKGTDLSVYSQAELDAIADSLNSRPRAIHQFDCPLNVFAAMLHAETLKQHHALH